MPTKAIKSHSLSIFLLKEDVRLSEAIKSNLGRVEVNGVGELYFKQNARTPPKWLTFFGDTLSEIPRLHNQSNGALLLVKRGRRHFALTFGLGRHLLEPGKSEESFGLRVTLNSVDPARLRSIDRRTFDAISSHTRTQASQEGDVTAFGLNVEQDLLRAATGSPVNQQLGKRMTGMDSLLVTLPININALPELLDKYLVQFKDESYKKTFPWVDHIGEVHDVKLRERLDQGLLSAIKTSDSSDLKAWLAVPDLIDWEQIGGFRYSTDKRTDAKPDLHLRDFLATVPDIREITIDRLRQRHAYAYDAADENWLKRWTLYSCLYGEIERDETTYLLSGGTWYRVEKDFVGAVDRYVSKLVKRSPLPPYSDASEGAYNRRVARLSKGKIALMDQKLIRVGGTTVEFCDLFTTDNQIIHVKRYGGSSVLSHLFAQGSVAANAFLEDQAFRAAVNARVPSTHQLDDSTPRPTASDFEVNYAIVSRSQKPIDKALPFFSRLNLRNAARQLKAFGYRVTLSKIETA